LVICLVGASVLLVVLFGLINDSNDKTEELINNTDVGSAQNSPYDNDVDNQILYNGEQYVLKEQLDIYLMIGIDQMLEGDTSRLDSHQADFLALIILDTENNSFQILHLNRDTMTDIPMIDNAGMSQGSMYGQIAMAHCFGGFDKARCMNTVNTVENLLYGIEIDHYISITMDAVAILNDSIGGVTLQLLDDFTELDPTYTKDAVVTLTGKQALSYVRERMSKDGSNLTRMKRQQQYIGALFDTYAGSEEKEHESSMETLLKVNEYMTSDCTINQLDSLSKRMKEYSYEGIQTLEGEAVAGEEYMEYYLDEAATQARVIELFYEPYKK